MSIGIFEVEAAPAAAVVDVAVVVTIGTASIRHAFFFDSGEDGIAFGIADVESVMVALAATGIVTRITPTLGLVGESERQAVVHLNAREKAAADLQTEDL